MTTDDFMKDVNEMLKESERNWQELKRRDMISKVNGTLVGRFISEPFADGYAHYRIVRENKSSVRIEHISGLGDDWVIPYWGFVATIDKDYAIASVESRDAMDALFGRV